MENWRPSPVLPKRYEVSDHGRIRSLWCRYGQRGVPLVMNPGIVGHKVRQYFQVGLQCGGKTTRMMLHRLILLAFVGPPEVGQEANHKDGDTSNNRLDNLEWVTRSEQHLHRCRVLRRGFMGLTPAEWGTYRKYAAQEKRRRGQHGPRPHIIRRILTERIHKITA